MNKQFQMDKEIDIERLKWSFVWFNSDIQRMFFSLQISRTQKPDYQPPPPPLQQHREIIAQPTKIVSDKRHSIKNEPIASNQISLYNDYRGSYHKVCSESDNTCNFMHFSIFFLNKNCLIFVCF